MRHETFPSPEVLDDLVHLDAMASYLREHGWCQSRLHLGESVCVLGAGLAVDGLLQYRGQGPSFDGLVQKNMGRTARLLGFSGHDAVAKFNDAYTMSMGQILARIEIAKRQLQRGNLQKAVAPPA